MSFKNSGVYLHQNQYTTPSTHHIHAGLELTTSLYQTSLRTDQKILHPKTLININF
jgi:hypothetical protein